MAPGSFETKPGARLDYAEFSEIQRSFLAGAICVGAFYFRKNSGARGKVRWAQKAFLAVLLLRGGSGVAVAGGSPDNHSSLPHRIAIFRQHGILSRT